MHAVFDRTGGDRGAVKLAERYVRRARPPGRRRPQDAALGVEDRNLITARNPGDLEAFSEAVLAHLAAPHGPG